MSDSTLSVTIERQKDNCVWFRLRSGCLTLRRCYYYTDTGSIQLGFVRGPNSMVRTGFMPGAQINHLRKLLDAQIAQTSDPHAEPHTALTSPAHP